MKIQRTLPPAAAPLYCSDLWNGFKGLFLGDKYLKRLEREIREYFGVKHVFLVSSGKAALYLILQALKSLRTDRNEVLIPAYTCFSVPSAIVKAGLKVALCDVSPETFNLDSALLKDAIKDTTLCVVPDHLFGISSDMDRIMELTADKGIFLVEDAAQAMGGRYKDKFLGTIGDVGFFSLGRGKNITCGSGGIIITNDNGIAAALEKGYAGLQNPDNLETLKDFIGTLLLSIFIRPWLYWLPAGLPFLKLGETIFYRNFPIKLLSGMKAGILKNWRKKLIKFNEFRIDNARKLCEKLDFIMHKEPAIPYLRFPLLINDHVQRNKLLNSVDMGRLGISSMYPTPVNEIKDIQAQFGKSSFPSAKSIAEGLLTIPTHGFVTTRYREAIIALLKNSQVPI